MKDFNACDRFYSEVLGWPVKRAGSGPSGWTSVSGRLPEGVEPRMLEVGLEDGSYLAFILGKSPDYAEDEPHIAIELGPGERSQLLQRLESRGVIVEMSEGENFAVYDPSGLRLEFY